MLQQTPAAFVQLRSIRVEGNVAAADISALSAMPALLNQRTLREIEFGIMIVVTDDMLLGLAAVTARLETLIIGRGESVTDAGLASLCGTPMTTTLRKFSLNRSVGITDAGVAALDRITDAGFAALLGRAVDAPSITDAGVAAVLGEASELRSLTLERCTLLSGASLTQLHEHCHDSLTEIDLSHCQSIDNAGAAALCNLRGLTELGLSETEELSVLPLERLPLLRAVKYSFLLFCSGLATLDLAALANVTSVGDSFLGCCSGLNVPSMILWLPRSSRRAPLAATSS